MPRGDGTGPAGMGPMTGRAAGYCAGFGAPGFASTAGWGRGGRGLGYGRGFGRGWGRGWLGYAHPMGAYASPPGAGPYAPLWGDVDAQLAALQSQAQWMRDSLSQVEERIKTLQDERETEGEA
jgi:hypothetical protein